MFLKQLPSDGDVITVDDMEMFILIGKRNGWWLIGRRSCMRVTVKVVCNHWETILHEDDSKGCQQSNLTRYA